MKILPVQKMQLSVMLIFVTQLCLAQVNIPADAGGSIFIVRHGEKEKGDDPILTPQGFVRAGDLMRRLQKQKITILYTTHLKRTLLTADSLRLLQQPTHFIVDVDTACRQLFNTIQQQRHWHKNILIVSHSHIIPKLLYKLGITDFPQQNLPEKEFDNLFIVSFSNGKASLKQEKYGASSPVAAPMKME